MQPALPPLRRGPAERFQAWLVTGPLGHLYSVVVDLAGFFVRSAVTRAVRRLRASPGGRASGRP